LLVNPIPFYLFFFIFSLTQRAHL
jgi:hypothetical protein